MSSLWRNPCCLPFLDMEMTSSSSGIHLMSWLMKDVSVFLAWSCKCLHTECQFYCWSSFSTQGKNFTAICLMFKCWIKMCHHVPKNIPRRLQTLLIIYHLPSWMADELLPNFLSLTWCVACMFKIPNQILATNMYTIKRFALYAWHQNWGSVNHFISPRSYFLIV